jgi:electron transport complex protein RnfG
MLVGLSPDGEDILGISVVEQVETPGLGGNITQEEFRAQFDELAAGEPITYVKNVDPRKEDNQVQALSGATITSAAVVDGINEHVGPAREIIERQAD